jgi:twinkle protein
MSVTTDPMDEVLDRLQNVSRHGDYWIASCPARDDRTPSMTIRRGDKGVLLHDFGGSTFEEIVAALGMEANDLFYDDTEAKRSWLDKLPKPRKSREYRDPEVPQDASFREGTIRWMKKRGISEATLRHFKVYSEAKHHFPARVKGDSAAICFPYFADGKPRNVKYRSVGHMSEGKEVKDFTMSSGAQPIWYNLDGVATDATEVVVVEGEMDVLALHEAGIANVVSPPNGCQSIGEEVMLSGERFLSDDRVRIILAGDMDAAGKKAMDDFAARIGKERCAKVQWPADCKDANDTLMLHGAEKVRACMIDARPYPIEAIVRISDVEDAVMQLYRSGLPRGLSTGIPSLDAVYTIKTGYFSVVTGSPGSGKTNLIDMIAVNLAEISGVHSGICSLENKDISRHVVNILPKHLRLPFADGRTQRMSEEEAKEGMRRMNEYIEFVQPDVPTLDEILKAMRSLVYYQGAKLIVIDPWNRLAHPSQGLSDIDHIARCLDAIGNFAHRFDVHPMLVAHPTKLVKDSKQQYPVPTLYDVAGSAHFYNMTDFGWSLWRDRKDWSAPIEFHLMKSRREEIATLGCVKLGYDPATTRYYDLLADGSNDSTMWRPPTLIDEAMEDRYASDHARDISYDEAEIDRFDPDDPENIIFTDQVQP